MPRKTRPLDRDRGVVRDASLIVIASEDEYVVRDYFSRFATRRVQVVVIPTEDGRSAPADVIARLDRDGDILQHPARPITATEPLGPDYAVRHTTS